MGSFSQAHLAFIAFPFTSHPATLFALADALAAAAPSATVSFLSTSATLSTLSRSSATAKNIHLFPISDGEIPDAPRPPNIEAAIAVFLAAAPKNLRDGLDAAAAAVGAPVSSVITDGFLWMAGEVTAALGVPWIPVRTGGPSAFVAHLYTDLLRGAVGVGDECKAEAQLGLMVPALAGYRVEDLPQGVVSGEIDSVISVLVHRMGQELPKAAAAVVCNSVQGLDPAVDADLAAKFPKYLPLGPFKLISHLPPSGQAPEDTNGCLTWLKGHAPTTVAYVSFGSSMTPPPAELCDLAEGLEASGVPFLWSLKDSAREQLPSGFLERTKDRAHVVSWAPQVEVLAHRAVGALVTHSGWNSVLESIAAGVPMICRPFFGDQRSNARAVSSIYGIGLGFNGGKITKAGVERALDTVLKGEEGERMRRRAGELKDLVSQAVAAGGSSTENLKVVLQLCGC